MAVLVDPLRDYGRAGWRAGRWCHMASDAGFEELHAMAARIGVRREVFQGDHYDLRADARARAVGLGAQEVSSRELVSRMVADRPRRRAIVARRRVVVAREAAAARLGAPSAPF